jgi:endonuclease/exonuclease/phosphatase (EEP) superfamily protein YafD
MKVMRFLAIGLGVLAVVLTAVSLLPSNDAFVRIWDFPRVQLGVLLALALLAAPWTFPRHSRIMFLVTLTFVAALAWHVIAVWPYTPLMAKQVETAQSCARDSRISLLIANVLMENEDESLFEIVERADPDVIMLSETDAAWDRRLARLRDRYPHAIRRPQDNTYGLHTFSRLPLVSPQVRFLVEDDVPSIKSGVRLPSGTLIELYGLHPKPPPQQDTAERDAEIILVGREVAKSKVPSIVLGDLNDVAWSDTTRLFQEVSHLLDPRIGRGTYDTFNVNWPLLKWPLDHIFIDASFQLLEMRVETDIGSDHYPVFVSLCFNPRAKRKAPQPEKNDLDEANEAVEEGREEEAEDNASLGPT